MYCCVLWLDRKYCRWNCAVVTPTHYRSSHWRCSMKKSALWNFGKFTGKHQCQRLFFNNVVGLWETASDIKFIYIENVVKLVLFVLSWPLKDLIWPVVLLFFYSWWQAEEQYLFAALLVVSYLFFYMKQGKT